ncbi:YczE/YyaS/YitT family protein [Mumia sp. Pv 4-285]|uniref:membrane protein YczE n=1 Tax=Mumia qirimensis TaxID=3234852 RepID=UPI00351D723A
MARPAYTPVSVSPVEQLRTGRLVRRLPQLVFGLLLYGWSMALMVEAGLGLDPWDVFHEGLTQYLPLTFGQITMVVGAFVLLLWIPLRQWPGIGTVLNVVLIGIAVDQGIALFEQPDSLVARAAMLVAGVVLNGLAGALYIGAHLGPGPRDGLFLGLVRRTGYSVRLMRTSVEITVLALGWLLGGTVGVGTVLYALAIGPIVQAFLPLVQVRMNAPEDEAAAALPAS